jgi:hypothetical protein
MNTRFYLVALFLGLTLPSLVAQSGDVPATREDVMKLFEVMNIRDQMHTVMASIVKQQRTMIHEDMKKRSPQISEQDLARMDQMSASLLKDLPVDGMIEDMVPVYQKHLTRGDVEAMGTFYSSPTGQKLLREMPEMTAESMQAAGPRIQAMIDKVMDQAEQMADKEHAKKKPTTDKN